MQISTLLELYGSVKMNAVPDWVLKSAIRHVGKRLPVAEMQEVVSIQKAMPPEATVDDFLGLPRIQELVTEVGDKIAAAFSPQLCGCGGEYEDGYCTSCLEMMP
jgi:hypothetical protein